MAADQVGVKPHPRNQRGGVARPNQRQRQFRSSRQNRTEPVARRRSTDARQPELFVAAPLPKAKETPLSLAWIEALLASEAFAAQRRLAGRGAPGDHQVRALLCALATRGGRISQTGLGQALSVPTLRISGIVSAARRILNLDQAQVVVMDGDDVVLDELLLRVQFQLQDEP